MHHFRHLDHCAVAMREVCPVDRVPGPIRHRQGCVVPGLVNLERLWVIGAPADDLAQNRKELDEISASVVAWSWIAHELTVSAPRLPRDCGLAIMRTPFR